MTELLLRGQRVDSVFELLGSDENSLTGALAFGLSRSPAFLRSFLSDVIRWGGPIDGVSVAAQSHEEGGGVTDVEIVLPGRFHLVLEAKRGWALPALGQLTTYARRIAATKDKARIRRIVTVSECSRQYAAVHLPTKRACGVPVVHRSWEDIARCVRAPAGSRSHAEKRLLAEVETYLRKTMSAQRKDSNLVYVVALSGEKPPRWGLSWIEIVEKRSVYFHPAAPHWPKEPPTYIGFRYAGRLQSIHFITKHEVIDDLRKACKEITSRKASGPFHLYRFGPPIRPNNPVKTGNIYKSGRVWCAIDLLLTCDTISEALAQTKARMGPAAVGV